MVPIDVPCVLHLYVHVWVWHNHLSEIAKVAEQHLPEELDAKIHQQPSISRLNLESISSVVHVYLLKLRETIDQEG